MALTPRGVEGELRDILSVSRAAAITGPRQAGKSTLAKQLQAAGVVPNYFSLDDEALRTAARADPDGFALSLRAPAVIDEVQRAPELMLAIKQILDRDQTPGQFLLTGSADLLTARVVADALPGRVEYVNLWPLSAGRDRRAERTRSSTRCSTAHRHRSAARRRVARRAPSSCSPAASPTRRARAPHQRARYFRSYVQTVLGRDLPEIGEVRIDASKLEQLLRLLAARTSGLVNYAALGRELALDDKTIKAHVELLRQLFLLYRLRPCLDEPRCAADQDAQAAADRHRHGSRARRRRRSPLLGARSGRRRRHAVRDVRRDGVRQAGDMEHRLPSSCSSTATPTSARSISSSSPPPATSSGSRPRRQRASAPRTRADCGCCATSSARASRPASSSTTENTRSPSANGSGQYPSQDCGSSKNAARLTMQA